MSNSSLNLNNFRVTYRWGAELTDRHFATLHACREFVRFEVQRPVTIAALDSGRRGVLFPSGYIRWNRANDSHR